MKLFEFFKRKVSLNQNEPLGMPKGSVRALIALSIVVFSMSFFWTYNKFPSELTSLIGVVIGYYFGARNSENIETNTIPKPIPQPTPVEPGQTPAK